MNGVAPLLPARAPQAAVSRGERARGRRPPRQRCSRPGAAGRWAAPARAARRPGGSATRPSCRSSTSPRSQARCQAAKSAYWTGSSGSGEGCPRRTRRRGPPARARSTPDGPAVGDDVVQVEQEHVLLLAQPQQHGPEQRPRGQVERPARLLARRAGERRLPLAAGSAARSTSGSSEAGAGRDHLDRAGRPRHGEGGAQRPRGGGRSRPGPRSRAGDVERPAQADGRRACCRRGLPGSSWSRNQSRCWAKESGRSPVAAGRARSGGAGGVRRRRGRAASAGPGRRPWAPRRAARSGSSTPKASRTRATTWVASSEWPPRSKKSSSAPDRARRPRTSPQIAGEQLLDRRARRRVPRPVSGAVRLRARAGPGGPPCRWESAAAPRATTKAEGTM